MTLSLNRIQDQTLSINDAERWRNRADEIRAMMEGWHDQELVARMETVAKGYDKLAEQAEIRQKSVDKRIW